MSQNIYDDPTFFEGYSQLRRSIEGLEGAPEWPALRALLPDLQGRRVIDLGCGFGWFCRWAREQGAANVLGLDLSQNMLDRARSSTTDPAITYQQENLETLVLPKAAFDLAFSSLTLHYIADLERLLEVIYQSLLPYGYFVFSIEHPIYMASRHPNWIVDPTRGKTWPVDQYQMEGKRTTNWLANGVVKYHRTLGTTLNALTRCGFMIRQVDEFGPSDEQVMARPELAEELERPMFVLISTQRSS